MERVSVLLADIFHDFIVFSSFFHQGKLFLTARVQLSSIVLIEIDFLLIFGLHKDPIPKEIKN